MQVMQDLMCVFVYTYPKRSNPCQISVEKQKFVGTTAVLLVGLDTHTDRSMKVDVD